eukprot:SAG25_NODE_31_length_20541_cov_59.033069_21_plen_57_part_00
MPPSLPLHATASPPNASVVLIVVVYGVDRCGTVLSHLRQQLAQTRADCLRCCVRRL